MNDGREPRGLYSLFVDRPVATAMLTLAIVVVGVAALLKLPLAFMPSGMASSRIQVWIPLAQPRPPREVELRITQPLEEHLRTIPGIKRIRSESESNRSSFSIELQEALDPTLAAAEVRDRIRRARAEWPADVDRYFSWREDASSVPLAFFQILTPSRDAQWDQKMDEIVRPRLEAVDGVGRVDLWGLLDETIRIWFDRDKLRGNGVDFRALLERMSGDNFTEPIGEIDNGEERLMLRVDGKFRSTSEIEQYPIRPGLVVGDVARIERVPTVRNSVSRYNEKYTYSGAIRATAGANPVETSARLRELVDELVAEPQFEGMQFRFLFDQGRFIEASLETLVSTALQGGVLALIVLFAFLRNVRLTLAIGIAIPLTLLVVAAQIYFAGGSLDILSMTGMTLAVGMVVDNSVVVLENIRRLRERGMGLRDACVAGTREVGLPVTMATMTTIVVFLPLIFMTGSKSAQAMMAGVGIPLTVALLGSLLVALFLLPTGVRWLDRAPVVAVPDDAPASRWSPITWLLAANGWMLRVGLRHRYALLASVVIGIVAMSAAGIRPYPTLDFESGDQNPWGQRDVTVHLEIPRGMTIGDVDREVKGYETFLLARRDEWKIDSVATRFSRTSARVDVKLHDDVRGPEITRIGAAIRAAWPRRPGITPTLRATGEQGAGGGSQETDMRNFVVRLQGLDSEFLVKLAGQVTEALRQLPGVESIDTNQNDVREEVVVDVDRDRAQELGVQPNAMLGTMTSGLQGRELSRFEEAGREVRLIAQFDQIGNPSLVDLKETQIFAGAGVFQRLADMSDVGFRKALAQIERIDGRTSVTIVGRRAEGVSAPAFREDLTRVMRQFPLPRGYSWTEDSPSRDAAMQIAELLQALLLAVTLVFLLMGILFESLILPASILVTIPIALTAATWSLKFFHGAIDPMAIVGLILLSGVVVNNGIVLLDCVERLRREGRTRQEAILLGNRMRMRPITMTASTTIVGLLPMALFGESSSQGLSYVGMSIAVAGGLAVCTLLTAFAVPLCYTFMDDLSRWLHATLRASLPKRARAVASPVAVTPDGAADRS